MILLKIVKHKYKFFLLVDDKEMGKHYINIGTKFLKIRNKIYKRIRVK